LAKEMDKLSGLILDSSDSDDPVEANKELDELVEDLILILKIKGQSQPYAFSLMSDKYLRNLILANISGEHERPE
jgi:hypothetical protein|tara:strand:+ start:225 stop:449 length:225 start_codon:yes stop_codon:yes gene_type:complete